MNAFVGPYASSFIGARPHVGSICVIGHRAASKFNTPRMTVTSQPPSTGTSPAEDELRNAMILPRVKKVPLKKGQQFSFVRFFVDDFEPSPYFAGLTGKGVKVAVLDTGCDPNHPALRNRIDVANSRNYTDDYNGDPNNWSDGNQGGHGTHCCGIIAAEQLGTVMYGVAPEATLVVKKVLDNRGGGRFAMSWCASAIRDCIKEGVNVINMSLGFPPVYQRLFATESDDLYRAVQEALAAGINVVVAAGNDGRFNTDNSINAPGAYGGVITVASHDDRGNRSTFSSYGGELDFMAPGEVLSARVGGGYHALQGTSMAAPLVAGLAALFVEASKKSNTQLSEAMVRDMNRTGFRARNPYEIRSLLRFLCERPNEHSRIDGYGRLVRAYEYVNGEVNEDM